MKATEIVKVRQAVAEQRAWVEEHGGGIAGYIARYGSKNDEEHYGDGGEAIYTADMAELEDRIMRLEGAMR